MQWDFFIEFREMIKLSLKIRAADKVKIFLEVLKKSSRENLILGPSGIGVDKSDQTLEWALFSWPQTHSCHFSFVQRQRRHFAQKSTSKGHQYVHH